MKEWIVQLKVKAPDDWSPAQILQHLQAQITIPCKLVPECDIRPSPTQEERKDVFVQNEETGISKPA